jgi:hypothetical protein
MDIFMMSISFFIGIIMEIAGYEVIDINQPDHKPKYKQILYAGERKDLDLYDKLYFGSSESILEAILNARSKRTLIKWINKQGDTRYTEVRKTVR